MSWRAFGRLATKHPDLADVGERVQAVFEQCPPDHLLDVHDISCYLRARATQVQAVFDHLVEEGLLASSTFTRCPQCSELSPSDAGSVCCESCGADPTDVVVEEVTRFRLRKPPKRHPPFQLRGKEKDEAKLYGFRFDKPIRITGNENDAAQYEVQIGSSSCFIGGRLIRLMLFLAQRCLTTPGEFVSTKEIQDVAIGRKAVWQSVSDLRGRLAATVPPGEVHKIIEGRRNRLGGYRLSTHKKFVKVDLAKLRRISELRGLVDRLFKRTRKK